MPLSSAHTDVMVESRRKTSVQVKVDDMLGERPPTSPHLSYSAPVLNAPVAFPLSTLSHAISSRVLRQGNDGVNHALVSRVRIPMIPLHRPLSLKLMAVPSFFILPAKHLRLMKPHTLGSHSSAMAILTIGGSGGLSKIPASIAPAFSASVFKAGCLLHPLLQNIALATR